MALKRFSHFGIAKTSMSEIADDLNLSKANLYYYFQDKFALIEAIVYGIVEESKVKIDQALNDISDTLELLIWMLDLKKEFLEKYYMLILNLNEMNINEERWRTLAKAVFEREVETTSRIFKKGIDRGELVTFEIAATSELYVAMIRGLAMFCDSATPNTFVHKSELTAVIERQKQAATIFINGVKN